MQLDSELVTQCFINLIIPDLVLGGLEEGVYYVEKLSNNQIKLYASRSFIPVSNNLEFTAGTITVGVATTAITGVSTIKLDSVNGIQVNDTLSNPNISNSGISTVTAIDPLTNIVTISGTTVGTLNQGAISRGDKVTISGKHSFVLLRHKNEQIGVQKILKKFPAM